MEYKKLPVGFDNFEDVITGEYYYVDKTLLIKELLDKRAVVTLITRPRRFGKSLNISMLQHFFENSGFPAERIDDKSHLFKGQAHLFDGLKIMDAGEKYTSHMGKYPVIKMTLKSVEGNNYSQAMYRLKEEVAREFDKHDYLLDSSKLKESEKSKYKEFLSRTAPDDAYGDALRFLSECLAKHHGTKTVILIDEYDVPLEKAHFNGYYGEMIMTLRTMYSNALKSNDSLCFAVLTGCLRISKESIFTGLNNLAVISILSTQYDEYFGFTESEMEEMLSYYGLSARIDSVRDWYDGYIFGNANVYNPWSVVMFLFDLRDNAEKHPLPYWSNTSSNSIVRDLVETADEEARGEIESLIAGGSITKPVHEDVTYSEIRENMDNLWNFLFFTGYLKKTGEEDRGRKKYCTLTVPNEEIMYIYERHIREWFDKKVKFSDPAVLTNAILSKDTDLLESELNKRLMSTISFYDSKEAFYHGFLLGILSNAQGFSVKSNREAGAGRSDIFMLDKGIRMRGVIFELKTVKKGEAPEEICRGALEQIEKKQYISELEEEGYRNIIKYGIAFRGKECMVMSD